MPLPGFLAVRVALALFLFSSGRLYGQTAATTDGWPQRGWLFLAVGKGSIENSIADSYGGSYSPGRLMFTLRNSGAEQIFGDGVEETAFLIGVRSTGPRSFVSAQLGPSAVHRFHTCDCSSSDRTGPKRTGLAFDVAVQGNWVIPGIGFDVFGDLFPSSQRYAALAVMVQLGWFGE